MSIFYIIVKIRIYTRYIINGNRDSKRRAKTFPGIAAAMAEQWAGENK